MSEIFIRKIGVSLKVISPDSANLKCGVLTLPLSLFVHKKNLASTKTVDLLAKRVHRHLKTTLQ